MTGTSPFSEFYRQSSPSASGLDPEAVDTTRDHAAVAPVVGVALIGLVYIAIAGIVASVLVAIASLAGVTPTLKLVLGVTATIAVVVVFGVSAYNQYAVFKYGESPSGSVTWDRDLTNDEVTIERAEMEHADTDRLERSDGDVDADGEGFDESPAVGDTTTVGGKNSLSDDE